MLPFLYASSQRLLQQWKSLTIKVLTVLLLVGVWVAHPAPVKAAVVPSTTALGTNGIHIAATPAKTKQASEQIDHAAEELTGESLNTTKRVIGKTEKRNEAIGYARSKAQQKLKALSEKVEKSDGKLDRSLTPTEKITVDQLGSRNQ